MPLSLNLPYFVCYPAVRLARRVQRSRPSAEAQDQAVYFDYQYRSSGPMRQRFMSGVPIEGQVVLDVGCGLGGRAPYWLERGAERVVCIDINRPELEAGRKILAAKFPAFGPRAEFLHPDEVGGAGFADVAILFDVFEHLVDPAAVLRQCHTWLRPGGVLWIGSIGWYHHAASHCGGHIPIPWCQVLFSERAIIRTIQSVVREPGYRPNVWERQEGLGRWDNIKSLKDRPGESLNLLSLRGIRRVLHASPFQVTRFDVHAFSGRRNPVARGLSFLTKAPVLKELFHSYYTAVLTKPGSPERAAVAVGAVAGNGVEE